MGGLAAVLRADNAAAHLSYTLRSHRGGWHRLRVGYRGYHPSNGDGSYRRAAAILPYVFAVDELIRRLERDDT